MSRTLNEDEFYQLVDSIRLPEYESVEHRLAKPFTFVNFDEGNKPGTIKGTPKGHKDFYLMHVRHSLEQPISLLTGKKVGMTQGIVSRAGKVTQNARRGLDNDMCVSTNKIVVLCRELELIGVDNLIYLTFERISAPISMSKKQAGRKEQELIRQYLGMGYNLWNSIKQ